MKSLYGIAPPCLRSLLKIIGSLNLESSRGTGVVNKRITAKGIVEIQLLIPAAFTNYIISPSKESVTNLLIVILKII